MSSFSAPKGEGFGALPGYDPGAVMFGRRFAPDVVNRYDSPNDIIDVLEDAMQDGAQVVLCGAHISRPVFGLFAAVQGDRVALLLESDRDTLIGLRSLCTLIFTHNLRQCMFFSIVLSMSELDEEGRQRLVLRIPTRIDEFEARWNKRSPIPSEIESSATFHFGPGVATKAILLDIGRGGAYVEFEDGECDSVPFGKQIAMTIRVGERRAAATGELRWRHGERCGICFSHFHDAPVLGVSEDLEAILSFVADSQESGSEAA